MSEIGTPVKAAPELERRLATIVCADVAGYSRMMGEDEERTVRVFRGHREIFETLVAQHRGRIFNTAGDALLAEFSSAVEAVRCATDIQSALRTRNDHLAPGERMQFRIGINLGDVIVQGGDLLGDGVNVAARIQQATEPGGICISGSVHEQIQNKLSLEFKLLGELAYKNIAKPVRTYTIAEGAAVTTPRRIPSKIAAALVAAGLVTAGMGWWSYTQIQAQRAQQEEAQAQLAAQKAAADRAQRDAEAAKREAQRVTEDSKREAQAVAQRQAAARAASAASMPYDGLYSGELCSRTAKPPECWPVAITLRNGVAQGSWIGRGNRTATAHGTVVDGALKLTLSAWSRQGAPIEAVMVGRVADGAIGASGKWADGGLVTGDWRRGSFASALPPVPPSKDAARYDGRYAGRLCNEPRDRKPSCWPVDLVAREGRIEGRWASRSKNTSRASGTIAADGRVDMKLNAWTPKGAPIEAAMAGRFADGALGLAGEWADRVAISGQFKRAP